MKKFLVVVLVALLAFWAYTAMDQGRNGGEDERAARSMGQRPVVLVSVSPYENIVRDMVGSDVEVRSVVPAGANCHSFDPPPSQICAMQKAVLWFTVGETFESALLKSIHAPSVVDLRAGLCLTQDTHIWTDPSMMRVQLATIRDGLIRAFPHDRQHIEERCQILVDRLGSVISRVASLLSGTKRKTIIVSHSAYGYLCREYGIEQLALEEGGKEASVASIEGLVRRARQEGIKTVFAVARSPKRGICRVAQAIGARMVELDPYDPSYFSGQIATAEAMHKALEETG